MSGATSSNATSTSSLVYLLIILRQNVSTFSGETVFYITHIHKLKKQLYRAHLD